MATEAKPLTTPTEVERKKIPAAIQREVDAEAGYRCGNPRCQIAVAVEYHHIQYVSESGKNEAWNLLPLCPTCHARHHSGEITMEAVRTWKGILVALNNAFDRHARDLLFFLWHTRDQEIWYSGDGALQFAGLVAAGLVTVTTELLTVRRPQAKQTFFFINGRDPNTDVVGLKTTAQLTEKGSLLLQAWLAGDEEGYKAAIATASPGPRVAPASQVASEEEKK